MPTISALDPSIRYDDRDAEQAQMRARNQDYMMRQYLQNQQMQAQQAAEQNRLGAQERMFGQELADRAAGRTASYGQATELARIGQQPAMASLDFMRQKYGDERSDTAGTRDYANALAKFRMNELQNVMGGAQQPGMVDPMAQRDSRALRFGLLGIQAPTDPQEQAAAFARQIIAQRMANADPADLGALGEAYKTGNLAGIPSTPKQAIDPAMLQEAVTNAARRFGEKDAATFGSDPTENDVADILRQRDRLAESVRIQKRVSPEEAQKYANFVIEQQFAGGLEDRWGTGWIQRLKEALRGGPASPVVEPGGSEFIPEAIGYNDIASLMRGARR